VHSLAKRIFITHILYLQGFLCTVFPTNPHYFDLLLKGLPAQFCTLCIRSVLTRTCCMRSPSATYSNTCIPRKRSRSYWPRGLRRRSSAARLLRLWVRIPSGIWVSVCCECCVLSGRGLCDGLITRPEESYRPWCVVVCDQETSNTRRLKPATGL
jgi:hypothetical protein